MTHWLMKQETPVGQSKICMKSHSQERRVQAGNLRMLSIWQNWPARQGIWKDLTLTRLSNEHQRHTPSEECERLSYNSYCSFQSLHFLCKQMDLVGQFWQNCLCISTPNLTHGSLFYSWLIDSCLPKTLSNPKWFYSSMGDALEVSEFKLVWREVPYSYDTVVVILTTHSKEVTMALVTLNQWKSCL